MKMKRKFEKGMTLPEVMTSVFIFSLLILLTSVVLREGQAQVMYAEARIDLEESLRQSIDKMGLEIRETSPSFAAIGDNGASLTFQIPSSVDDAGAITWSGSITYQIVGSQLVRLDTVTGETKPMANDIQTINFTSTGNPVSTLVYTVTARRTLLDGRDITVTSTGEARLRNV